MVATTIKIIVTLLNNNIDYWLDEDNRKQFIKLFEVLDYSKGTFAPEVFNEQSLQLAVMILGVMKTIQQTDIAQLILPDPKQKLEAKIGQLLDIINSLSDYLIINISFYNLVNEDQLLQLKKKKFKMPLKPFPTIATAIFNT